MPEFNPFDMDFDGDVDGIDLLGFDYLARWVLQQGEDEWDSDASSTHCANGEWDEDETEVNCGQSEIDGYC
jgi:hypothetical protein